MGIELNPDVDVQVRWEDSPPILLFALQLATEDELGFWDAYDMLLLFIKQFIKETGG